MSPAAQEAAAPVQFARASSPAPAAEPTPLDKPSRAAAPELTLLDGPDLGAELLSRLPAFATPPTLGRLGGLPAMAQTLPTVERFLQKLPAPPPEPLLAGLGAAGDFAANLPSLVGFAAPAATGQPPAFPAQLEPPSEPTDILAPPGGMPGQLAGLSGAAPVLSPQRPAAVQPLVVPLAALPSTASAPPAPALPAATAPVAAVERAVETLPRSTAPVAGASISPAAPSIVSPIVPPLPAISKPAAPITQILPLQQTLTANVLPGSAFEPIQRAGIRQLEPEWTPPSEFVQPREEAGERVSPAQREAIETQRGQGQPLAPETRQRFEQAYGQPLDDVRVHTGPTAHAAAESLNAIAFASGPDLFFTNNTFAPDNPQGLSLLGHELAHVIQQQYGVSGDADALRPPDDRYERQADLLASRALETPVAQPAFTLQPRDTMAGPDAATAEPGAAPAKPGAALAKPGASVQRAPDDELRRPGAPLAVPAMPAFAPGQHLATAANASPQPLASGALAPSGKLPEDEPVQRFTLAGGATVSSPRSAVVPVLDPAAFPSLESAPRRLGSLTEQLLSPTTMLSHLPSLSQNLPGLGLVSQAGQALPVFRSLSRGMPGLGSLPDLTSSLPDLGQSGLPDAGDLANQMPSAARLPGIGSAAPAMPDLGGLAQGLGAPGLPRMPGLPSLGGLTPPAMPLAQGSGAMGQAAGDAAGEAAAGAQAAGQQALGTITSMAPGGADGPATPPLPSLDKLTEHVWKEVQRKLKVERERSRGLA